MGGGAALKPEEVDVGVVGKNEEFHILDSMDIFGYLQTSTRVEPVEESMEYI